MELSRTEDILKAILNGTTYDGPILSRIEALLVQIGDLLATKADLDSDGLIPASELPPMVFEHMYVVDTDADRFNLTTDEVQNGDIVYVNVTELMYFVIDDTKLDREAGYKVFAAGTAARAIGDKNGNDITTTYQPKIDSTHKLDSELIDDDGNISALVHCYRAYYRTQQNTLTILDNREAEFLADMAADRSGNPRTIMLDLSVNGNSKGILRNMGNGFYGERHSATNNGFDTIIALNIEMTLDPPSIYYMAYNEKPYSFALMSNYSKPQTTSAITNTDTVSSAIGKLEKGLDTKQDALTFDTTPTQDSTNPVTSGGIYNVIGDINTVLEEVL